MSVPIFWLPRANGFGSCGCWTANRSRVYSEKKLRENARLYTKQGQLRHLTWFRGRKKKNSCVFFFSISLFLSLHFRAIITTTFIIHLAPTVWFAPWKGANAQLEALLHRCQSPYTCRGRAFCCAIHNSECIKAKTLTCGHCELEGSYTPRRSILFF